LYICRNKKYIKMIKTTSRAYPKGKVPKDFENWLIKINQHGKNKLLRKPIKYVESFPFRKEVQYKNEAHIQIDINGNKLFSNVLIRNT